MKQPETKSQAPAPPAELSELRRRVAAQAEALQRREFRRQLFEAQVREREAWLEERDAEIEYLTSLVQMLQPGARRRMGPEEPDAGSQLPSAVPATSAAVIAEARIAALSSELQALHARAAANPAMGEQAPAARDESPAGLQAEVAELRLTNEQLRSELAAREARLPPPPDTGTFAPTGDFGVATGSGTYGAADSQLRMLVRTEGDTGVVHVLGRRTTIGRTPDNDLCVDSEAVSRHHAVALQSANGTVIEDLNSTNGVYVNGQRCSRRQLAEGDVVTIGTANFRFLVKHAEEAANS